MSLRVLIFICGLVWLMGATPSAFAANDSPTHPDSDLVKTIQSFPGQWLSLADALTEATAQASTARAAEARLDASKEAVRREKGAFDPELYGAAQWSGDRSPTSSTFAGADVLETESSDYSAGAHIKTQWGTELTASMNSLRLSSNSQYAGLSPQYQSFAALNLRQPLLKGFGPSAASDLNFAQSIMAADGARYQGAVLNVQAEVETVYWQLYAAERNHAVTIMIRDRTSVFLDETRKRANAGMIGPGQVANAEFFLTEAEQAVLDTEEQMDRASDRLASLMGRRAVGQRFRPQDEPPRDFPHVDQDSLVAMAIQQNPELQAIALDTEALRARERGAVWDARPSLDLVGSLGGNGLTGDPTAGSGPFPDNINGGRGDSASQALTRDFPAWDVGFVFSIPLGNRQGKGERQRWRAEIARAEQLQLGAQRLFEEEVRAQYRELERGKQRLEIATRGVTASTQQVDFGLIEYRNGRTTAFELVRLAADLATAQQRYSDAIVRTVRAVAVLRQLTGGWYPGTKESGS